VSIVRLTRQRQAVLHVVRRSQAHPDAASVFEEVRRELPNISLATVYRSLEALAIEGHIAKIEAAGGPARFDGRTHDHPHFVCTHCGAVMDIDVELPNLCASVNVPGLSIQGAQVQFYGVCSGCANNPTPKQ
jgi:Fur family transcriptional regulator, ferric uptake regulator